MIAPALSFIPFRHGRQPSLSPSAWGKSQEAARFASSPLPAQSHRFRSSSSPTKREDELPRRKPALTQQMEQRFAFMSNPSGVLDSRGRFRAALPLQTTPPHPKP